MERLKLVLYVVSTTALRPNLTVPKLFHFRHIALSTNISATLAILMREH